MTRVRVGTLNIPLDAAKLPNGQARAKIAAQQITAANLDVLAVQELDRTPAGAGHVYATLLLEALGGDWRLIKPTSSFNENYIFYRPSKRVKLKRTLADVVLTSSAGGRHATRATFTVDGRTLAVRSTHLVHGKANAAAREEQGKQLAAISGPGTVILGDLNQVDVPAALATDWDTARAAARATTNAEFATFAKWGATKATDVDAYGIDHILVPGHWIVRGYTVIGLDSAGVIEQPRISDHFLIIASVEMTSKTKATQVTESVTMNTSTLQAHLNELGFLVGRVDGISGAKTRDGIRRFQRAWNLGPALAVDGIPGPKTYAAIAMTNAQDGRLSEHFKASELRCKCLGKYKACLGVNVDRRDLQALEQLRAAAYPKGLQIVSAYRCPGHNKAVGGASASQHVLGRAFDIPAHLDVKDPRIPSRFKGRGHTKAGRVRHVDSRPNTARWEY